MISSPRRLDLSIVVLSMSEAHWLKALLPTIEAHAGDITIEVVVADIESTDDTADVIDACSFARRVPVLNGGFAHANNAALGTVDARYVLFLNADTEIVAGTFEELLTIMQANPDVGMLGVRQLDSEGEMFPTMRRFVSARRRLAEALWSERLAPALGTRVLDMDAYERRSECDWTIGSFMLLSAESLASTGYMDERFFFTAEEQDLCLRLRQAGWTIMHVPEMTIVHHVGKRGANPKIEAQQAFSERQYAFKHFGPLRRHAYVAALAFNYALRSIPGVYRGSDARLRRQGARRALSVVLGREGAPFMPPPAVALPSATFDAVEAGRAV